MNIFRAMLMISILAILSCTGTQSVKNQLDSRIPPPDPSNYEHGFREDWQNPILTYRANGVEVTSKVAGLDNKLIPVSQLSRVLIELPVNAWPYGRVVSTGKPGLSAAFEEPKITETEAEAEKVLKSLGVESLGRMRA